MSCPGSTMGGHRSRSHERHHPLATWPGWFATPCCRPDQPGYPPDGLTRQRAHPRCIARDGTCGMARLSGTHHWQRRAPRRCNGPPRCASCSACPPKHRNCPSAVSALLRAGTAPSRPKSRSREFSTVRVGRIEHRSAKSYLDSCRGASRRSGPVDG